MSNSLTAILGLLLALANFSSATISWQQGDWAFSCDFNGNDLISALVPADQCGPLCEQTTGCTHFTWTTYESGTCWMKKNAVSKADAFETNDPSMVCGVSTSSSSSSSSSIQWQGNWAFACDFQGGDISSAQTTGEQCGGTCSSTDGCTHFTWTGYNGGTCWMKGGQVAKSDAFFTGDNSVVCGLVTTTTTITTTTTTTTTNIDVGNSGISTTAYRITVQNSCNEDIWVGAFDQKGKHPNNGGWLLSPGQSSYVDLAPGFIGRFWPRTKCVTRNNQFTCATGDCGSKVQCAGATGVPPVSLAEFTLLGRGKVDFWDVSFVDGSSIPIGITPVAGTYAQGHPGTICRAVKCNRDMNANCPNDLRQTYQNQIVGCKSACLRFNQDRYCCRGLYNCSPLQPSCPSGKIACDPKTWPTNYAQYFKNACRDAYSFAYDDNTSTFTCYGQPLTNYVITFCPV